MARPDPVYVSSRREAILVFVIFAIACTHTVVYTTTFGYNRPIDSLRFVFGFPDWVFYGIVVPWGLCVLISWGFGALFVRDEDLGEDEGDSRSEGGDLL